VSRRRERSAKTAGGPGPPTGSRTPIYYPDPSAGREQTPRLGQVRSRHVSAGAGTRAAAKLPREDSPTYRIQYGRRKYALPQQSPRRLLPGCTVDRALPRHTVQPLAPPTPRMSVCYASWTRRLAFAHHDAYAVDPTVYAATYTTSTGASPTGQVNPLLGQRVHRAMKRIRGEILNHCSTINAFCAVYYTSALDPPVGVSTPVYASPWAIKGRRPLEKGEEVPAEASTQPGQRIDSFICKSNTTHSGCRVLRSGGPNHSKSSSVLVFLLPR